MIDSLRRVFWWLMDHDPFMGWLAGVFPRATSDGILVGVFWVMTLVVVVDLLWRLLRRPLNRAYRAFKLPAAPVTPPEPQRAPEVAPVPQFGTPVTLLYNPEVHGPYLACSSGVKCFRRQFTEGEVFFRIAEATDHHPMVAVCTDDVVLRDGALDGRAWTDEPLDSATVYDAPRAGRR